MRKDKRELPLSFLLVLHHMADQGFGARRFLTERLLTYACGRKFDAADRGSVESVAAAAEAKGSGLRDLVESVVVSESFRGR